MVSQRFFKIPILNKTPNWKNASEAELLSSIYILLGSIEYSVISEPTLNSIYGKKIYSSFKNNFPQSLRNMVLITVIKVVNILKN